VSRARRSGEAGDASADDAPPPLLGAWRNLYALVIAVLFAIIALLWWFSKAFA
jgi:hypothetical protein